jgi:hypothetical protein
MLTRGKLLGDIMDGLGQLNFVLQTRSKLGLYDLNKHCEDFIKDFLNIIYEYNLVNLNQTRSNEPGLDLGDDAQKLGVQVTTDKKSDKINHTLEKITDEQKARYERFVILILGAKQRRYDGISPELAANLHFEIANDIWDFGDLERAIVSLPLDKINSIYNFLQSNLIRVFSDLDVGTTPSGESTSMLDQLEPRPVNKYMGCSSLVAHINEKHGVNLEIDVMNPSYQMFYDQLAKLPKITREFYYALLSRSEFDSGSETYGVREPLIRRLLNISQTRYNEEIKLLEAYNLANLIELNEDDYWIMLEAKFKKEPCLVDMMEYIEEKGFDLKKIFVDLDFTCFS